MKTIGILALQGDFASHGAMLESIGVAVRYVRSPEDLGGIDGIVLPGGESTTIGRLMVRFGIIEPLRELVSDGVPTFGTCAGMILLAKQNDDPLQFRLNVLDIDVERNAYGRQVESFETDVRIETLGEEPFRAVFIRAPVATRVGEAVRPLALLENRPIMLRQEHIVATSFHPELTDDTRVHRFFLDLV